MICDKCKNNMELKSVNTEVYMISIIEYKCKCGKIKTIFINRGENNN